MRTFYFKHFLLVVLAFMCNAIVCGHDFEVDGIFYNINGDEAIVTFKGESSRDYSDEYRGDVILPENVTFEGKTYPVTTIGRYAFDLNYNIKSITIPNSVKKIEELAFQKCSGLTELHLPNSVTHIADYAFVFCDNIIKATIPNNLDSLGIFPFQDCSSLRSATIPACITDIVWGMFYGCKKLESVTILGNIVSIDQYAFNSCEVLESITIPGDVKSIGSFSFYRCKALTSIYLTAALPPTADSNVFSKDTYTNATLYVPVGSIGAYAMADVWSNFSSIKEYDITAVQDIEVDAPAYEITDDGILLIAAEGKSVSVYNLNGVLVKRIKSYSGERIALGKGVYIAKVDNKAIKVKI